MPYENLLNFSFTVAPQDSLVDKMGSLVYVFEPITTTRLGYEDVDNKFKYKIHKLKIVIDFNPARRVYYHFNWFPEDQQDLSIAYFNLNAPIREESFIRTRVLQNDSPYGDMIFKIVRVFDEGKFRVLKRTWFLKPVSDSQLAKLLVLPKDTKEITQFKIVDPAATGSIDQLLRTITVHVPVGTDLTKLKTDITFLGLEVSPVSGRIVDFTNPLDQTVVAENGTTVDYTVEVIADV